MSTIKLLWVEKDTVYEKLLTLERDAKEHIENEKLSSIKIQRLFRGYTVRRRIYNMNFACNEIQRVFRGYQGRCIFNNMISIALLRLKESFHAYHAISIQRIFRGFYSRKYIHNYLKRHEYIESVKKKGEEVREMMKKYREELEKIEMKQETDQQEAEFRSLTSRLHHLVSTSTTPGIYSSFNHQGLDSTNQYSSSSHSKSMSMSRTVKGLSIEDHLEASMKETLKQEREDLNASSLLLAPDLSGNRQKVPLTLPSSRLSIQASTPYELPELEEKKQRRLTKLKLKGHASFLVGKPKKSVTLQVEPISEPYLDPWENPYLKRGVPKNQKELTMQRTSFEKAPDIPFHSSVGGNKSSVLPNDRFDVIMEAEQSGGVTQKHKGKGRRFGLADTCDNPRLPAPP